jgi:ketosteroid isomerase-like protein
MLGRSARCTVAALMLAFWGSLPPPAASQAPGSDGAALIGILLSTTDKWNSGDLDGFIAPYAGIATFMTPAGPIGRDAMRARYAARYFTGSRPDQQLRFDELEVRGLGPDHALMTGRFWLSGGGKAEQTGRFTLVWMRTPTGWRILHDHSS